MQREQDIKQVDAQDESGIAEVRIDNGDTAELTLGSGGNGSEDKRHIYN